MSNDFAMGIVATGMYLPDTVMTAEEISEASGMPLWVVKEKLGITQKHITAPGVHPNMMAAKAANQAIEKAGIDPMEIDVLLCTTEEWKEYALWTAGIDLATGHHAVAARLPVRIHYSAQHAGGIGTGSLRSDREVDLAPVGSHDQRPAHLVHPQDHVRQLSRDIRIGHALQNRDRQIPIQTGLPERPV